MTTDVEHVLAGVGERLRSLRKGRGLTLSELAELTGLSASTLSRLETGRLNPTLEQMLPLARAFGVPLDDMVGAPPTGDPRVHLRPVKRFGLTFVPLTRRGGGVQAFKVIHPPARQNARPKPQSHEGYEWLYVMNGEVRLVLGEQDLLIGAGEAAEFDTRVPHWIGNTRAQPTELLMLYGVQGERAHVTASNE